MLSGLAACVLEIAGLFNTEFTLKSGAIRTFEVAKGYSISIRVEGDLRPPAQLGSTRS